MPAERKGIGMFEGIIGTVQGSFYRAPLYVDEEKPAGHSSLTKIINTPRWWLSYWNPVLRLFFSPNAIWCAIAAIIYFGFPMDMETDAKNPTKEVILNRVLLHTVVVWLFFGFWHVTCYWFGWTTRPFDQKEEGPTKGMMLHNFYYSTLGGMQSGLWEVAIMYVYASGLVPYTPDSEAFSLSTTGLINFLLIAYASNWRDTHFYFAHRLIHVRFIYKHVHSLHHRNVQIEPFAGLCMHPVEHLYYYSCAAALMWFGANPFIAIWTLVHALVSPAASHSGFEDIWQSDQFHNLHHAYFECNYGSAGFPWDYTFGTLREKFGKSETYKGTWTEGDKDVSKEYLQTKNEKKKFLRGGMNPLHALWASPEQAIYDVLTCVALPLFLYTAIVDKGIAGFPLQVTDGIVITAPQVVGFVLGYGPPLVGLLLWFMGDPQPVLWPFHKVRLFILFIFLVPQMT